MCFFQSFSCMDLLHIYTEYSDIIQINCENLKEIHAGKASKEIHLYLLLFDVGGLHDITIMADDASRRNFKLHDLFPNL